jgi:hypothetical protein
MLDRDTCLDCLRELERFPHDPMEVFPDWLCPIGKEWLLPKDMPPKGCRKLFQHSMVPPDKYDAKQTDLQIL